MINLYRIIKNRKYNSIKHIKCLNINQFSTEVIERETKTEIGKLKKQKNPFMKGIFLGKFDNEMLTYPEILNSVELAQLKKKSDLITQSLSQVDYHTVNKTKKIPEEAINNLKSLGLFGLTIPEEYGGLGLRKTEICKLNEAITNSSIGCFLTSHQSYGITTLLKYGSRQLKEQYLPKMASGEYLSAFCLNEPNGGHDLSSINCKAYMDADGFWYLSGTKSWIPKGADIDVFTVFAKTQELSDENEEVTCFLVEKSFGNITFSDPGNVIGNIGSQIVNVHFNKTKIHNDNIIGTKGLAFQYAMDIINKARMYQVIPALAPLKQLIKETTDYAINTNLFGKSLKEYHLIQNKMANVSINTYILESMIYLTTGILDTYDEPDCDIEFAIIKNFFLDKCVLSANTLLEVVDEKAFLADKNYDQLLRDLRIPFILEANQDVICSIISLMGLQYAGTHHQDLINKTRNPLMNPGFIIKRIFSQKNIANDNPENYKDLEQYLHPTLKYSAKQLEFCVAQLAFAVEIVLTKYGNAIMNEQIVNKRIAQIASEIYAMTALLGRASRSYCIGLRNAQMELYAAMSYCHQAEDRVRNHLKQIASGISSTDDLFYDKIAEEQFNNFGYLFEHPLTRNY